MAYVLWRVFMKKYSKVRLGIRSLPVTPAEHREPERDESWTLASDEPGSCSGLDDWQDPKHVLHAERCPDLEPSLPRSHETRKSKAKRVKNYLRKCKDALSKGADEGSVERKRENCTSWYVEESRRVPEPKEDPQKYVELEPEAGREDKSAGSCDSSASTEFRAVSSHAEIIASLDNEDDRGIEPGKISGTSLYEVAAEQPRGSPETKSTANDCGNIGHVTSNNASSLETLTTEDSNLNKCDSSDTLIADVADGSIHGVVELDIAYDDKSRIPEARASFIERLDNEGTAIAPAGGRDVASLVRSLLGPIYGDGVLDLLIRQARDILVCAYHGNLENFVRSYLSPAAALLAEVKRVTVENGNESVVPAGWPLTIGDNGLVLQLGDLEASALRLGECYLCVRNAAAADATDTAAAGEVVERSTVEIALVWRTSMRSPGFLGWDREDEYMDWRDFHKEPLPSSSLSSKSRLRRGSREEIHARPRDTSSEAEGRSRERPTNSSLERIACDRCDRCEPIDDSDPSDGPIVKSKSTSGVDSRKEEAKMDWRRRSNNSSLLRDEARKVKRSSNVSSMTMESWREASRYVVRSRALSPSELKTPFALETIASSSNDSGLDERLRNAHPNELSDDELAEYIGTLLVSVERTIERVSLDDLAFPCPGCRNIDTDDPLLGCKCDGDGCECDSSREEANRSFEVAGIKHIDSDDEEEVRMGFGTKKRVDDVTCPRTIYDLADHVLTCGLTLPGYRDATGRPVIEYDSDVSTRETVSACEMASFLLYLARLPSCSSNRTGDEFTLLVTGDFSGKLKLLDDILFHLQDRLRVPQVLLLLQSTSMQDLIGPSFLRSQIKAVTVYEENLCKYIPRRDEGHDQARWIAFYKEYDALMTEWQAAGRRLALEMSELRDCSNLSGSLGPLTRLLADPTLRRTSRDGEEAISALEERALSFSHVDYIASSVERARRLVEEVGNASTRLESSFESRRATIRNLAVLRSIEDQAHEVLSWLCKKGEDILSKHAEHTATTLTAARLHEREFEKFYFTSMRHLDKGSDLAEAASASGLRELARSLKQHLRGFGSRLEDRREHLEDTSRCCLLQDRAYEWAQEARIAADRRAQQFLMARPPLPPEHFTEMMSLAEKLGNEILLEQCRIARNKCTEALELTRTLSAPGSPARRRSFAASESSTSWDDALVKRTSWDDSDSASYVYPMESTGSGSRGRPVLDNIAELRESAEQLLDCSPPRTPPQSPAPRRLVKPPVNSHLHRAPSIAPGMKVKKTILLIMREMIQTERDYVKSLEYIIENYIPELVREDIPQALRGQRNVIFGNVEKIYEFHSQHFLRELEQCEQCPMLVGQSFLRHEKKFYLYALYNKNKPNSDSLMAEYGTAFFKTKQLELGDKMDLASYLLKPVQRMGKYALLLQQLVKAGTDLSEQLASKDEKEEKEDSTKPMVEGEADLRAAEQMVRFQLRHGNDLLAMDSLRDCDVNVKEQGRLLRQNEFLVWQGKGKKCLRQVFLFEDLILFSKARRFPDRKNLDIYIYKHSIKTTDIGLTAVIADSPTKFEIWFRKRKPGDTYTLQCASEDIKKAWAEELSNLLWKQALRNREVRLAEMSSMGIGNKPCLDIRPSADQINDRSISVAQLSKTPRFRNSIAVSILEDSGRCSRRPHSVISVSSSSSSGGSSGPAATLHLGLDASPRPHHRSTTLNSQCSVESGIIADISIVSDDGGDGADRGHWNSTLESPMSHLPTTSTPIQSPTSAVVASVTSPSSSDANLMPYDQDMSINL